MPDEIRSSPGYHPFTLSSDSQDWVDSMAEVVDGGDAVYGRPKPAAPTQHRSLATSLPSLPPSAVLPPASSWPGSASSPHPSTPTPRSPRVVMPDIDSSPDRTNPPPPARPHVLMPDIESAGSQSTGSGPPLESHPSPATHHPMPDIGGDSPAPVRARTLPRRVLVPEIGAESSAPAPPRDAAAAPGMPDIGGDSEVTTSTPRRARMPEIG